MPAARSFGLAGILQHAGFLNLHSKMQVPPMEERIKTLERDIANIKEQFVNQSLKSINQIDQINQIN